MLRSYAEPVHAELTAAELLRNPDRTPGMPRPARIWRVACWYRAWRALSRHQHTLSMRSRSRTYQLRADTMRPPLRCFPLVPRACL